MSNIVVATNVFSEKMFNRHRKQGPSRSSARLVSQSSEQSHVVSLVPPVRL